MLLYGNDLIELAFLASNFASAPSETPNERLTKMTSCVRAGSMLQVRLSANDLSGTIPEILSYLSLTHLSLSRNRFNGTLDVLPAFRFGLTIRLDSNEFTGTLPSMPFSIIEVGKRFYCISGIAMVHHAGLASTCRSAVCLSKAIKKFGCLPTCTPCITWSLQCIGSSLSC